MVILHDSDLRRTLEVLKKNLSGTIQVIVSTVARRGPYISGHQQRVAHLACAIGLKMRWSEEIIEGLRMAGMIHDLGKIAIPRTRVSSLPGQHRKKLPHQIER